jgi:hypothetical protein
MSAGGTAVSWGNRVEIGRAGIAAYRASRRTAGKPHDGEPANGTVMPQAMTAVTTGN